jgi:MFS family permease
VLSSLVAGLALTVAFVAWELRAPEPMLPMRFFRNRMFAATNAVTLAMYFGMFGSIFLLAQFLQTAQGYTPLQAGLRTLPWTAMPMLISPIAGPLSDRLGPRPLMFTGLLLQAVALGLLAAVLTPDIPYPEVVVPFVISGAGMALVFAPSANAVLTAVKPEQAGQASGATNTIRELGGVLGIAVLASVFAGHGGYASPHDFVAGIRPALVVGAAGLTVGALAAIAIPAARRTANTKQTAASPA